MPLGKHSSLLLLIVAALIFSTCRKDNLITDSDARLSFSLDTLTFDTVFTQIGSTTLSFKVYNTNNQRLNISVVKLAGGAASQFRMNVDGFVTTLASDIEIAANDSMYLFVEVTVDPGAADLPFVIEDQIVFVTNGNTQSITLQAWGQNAHFFKDSVLTCSTTWTDDKPYVILNYVLVDSQCTLTINEGVRLHFYGSSFLFVKGTLEVNGTIDSLVRFRGVRLEAFYKDIPGQWFGIVLLRGSINSRINYAEISNSIYGVSVGSLIGEELSTGNAPDLRITNTVIKNSSVAGMFGFLAVISAENCLVYNSGTSNLIVQLGGIYEFNHCTLANFSSANLNHDQPLLYLADYIDGIDGTVPVEASFTNTILYGKGAPNDEEIFIDFTDTVSGNTYIFQNCLIQTQQPDTLDISHYLNNVLNKDPLFVDYINGDYNISLASPCNDAGAFCKFCLATDLAGMSRSFPTDIGAYEAQ